LTVISTIIYKDAMNVEQLTKHYGTQAAAAEAIDITPQAVSKWKDLGAIPIEYQIKWEVDSGGALKADLPDEIRNPKPHEAVQ